MKKTKSMYYSPSHESTELVIFISNTRTAYFNFLLPVIENLKKKYKAGKYNKELAIIAYYNAATAAAKYYGKIYGNNNGLDIFNVTSRYTAAIELEEREYEHVTE